MISHSIGIRLILIGLLPVVTMLSHCVSMNTSKSDTTSIFFDENLLAWCIIPFDAAGRGPEERAALLTELGLNKLAWDWRPEHLDLLPKEIEVLKNHGIELSAVWLWIDNEPDDGFPSHLEKIFKAIEASGTQTTFWVSFPRHFFEGLTDEDAVSKGAGVIGKINGRAMALGCRVALYNHMDWFGEPANQVRVIQAIGSDNVGIVYNFHHGHHQIGEFPELLDLMMPYLWTINLNGMSPDGPKILDIGAGTKETGMIKTILESGYRGEIGIIGHTEGEDIKDVLVRNLKGLHLILENIQASEDMF